MNLLLKMEIEMLACVGEIAKEVGEFLSPFYFNVDINVILLPHTIPNMAEFANYLPLRSYADASEVQASPEGFALH